MVGFAGLNSIAPPTLQTPFAPMNGLALQQQAQGSGYTPAYAPPSDVSVSAPDAASSLSALMSQMGPNARAQPHGVAPNSSTPPAPDASANGAGGSTAAPAAQSPGAPMTFQDMLHAFAQAKAGSGLGSFGQIGQNVAANIGNSPIGQLFAHLTASGSQGPNLGPLPTMPMIHPTPSIVPDFRPGGVLGSLRAPIPAGAGILGG